MAKKIVDDWTLGTKFRELLVFTYNYNEESLTRYGRKPDGNGGSQVYKQVAHLNYGEVQIYKPMEGE